MNKIDDFYAVIMAGGGGTRLWPLSRKSNPKQMISIQDNQTMFQKSVSRLTDLFDPERILIVTVAEQAVELKKQTPEIPDENFLIEPFPRGTASVVGLAATYLHKKDNKAVMAILTADHFIENEDIFHHYLSAAYDAAKENFLVTLGIQPTFASTGFGYIQRDQAIGKFNNVLAYKVKKFKEKPAQDLANTFFNQGDHDWNSGMFIWRVDNILEEFERQMPELFAILRKIDDSLDEEDWYETVKENWGKIHPQTIDYGIMENANRVIVIPAEDLGWNDVGSWESFFDVVPADDHGNIIMSKNHLSLDTEKTLVYSLSPERMIVTLGLENMIVVDTGDALLVCPREKAQDVKRVVSYLKEHGRENYL